MILIPSARTSLIMHVSTSKYSRGMTADEATEDVLNVQLPRLKRLMDNGELHVDNIDVFCEQGVYSVDQTKRILQAGLEMGLAINFHGEELHRLNSAEVNLISNF